MLIAILHFFTDDQDPQGIVSALVDALPSRQLPHRDESHRGLHGPGAGGPRPGRRVSVALGVTGDSGDSGDAATVSERTVERVAEINRNIGVPTTLAEIGITREDLPRIAGLALLSKRLVNAPARAGVDLLTRILEAAHSGDRTLLRNATEIEEAEKVS